MAVTQQVPGTGFGLVSRCQLRGLFACLWWRSIRLRLRRRRGRSGL